MKKNILLILMFVFISTSFAIGGGITIYSGSGQYQTGKFIPASDGAFTVTHQQQEQSSKKVPLGKQVSPAAKAEKKALEAELNYYNTNCHNKHSRKYCIEMSREMANLIYELESDPELYFSGKPIREKREEEERQQKILEELRRLPVVIID